MTVLTTEIILQHHASKNENSISIIFSGINIFE